MTPDRDAVLAAGYPPLAYGALWAGVNDIVRALRSFGIGRGDRVAVVLPDGPEMTVAVLAVAAGAVCVPLNPGFTADEWHFYFGDLRVAALLTRPDMDAACRGVAHTLGLPVIDLSPGPNERPGGFSMVGPPTRRTASSGFAPGTDDAFILLTSGTTSRPKMVPLTHASVCLSAYNAGAAFALGPRDRLLSVLPLFHAHGLISGLLTALGVGSSVVSTPGFDVGAFFGWLTEFRPTWYTAVPAMHRALLSAAGRNKGDNPSGSLRLIRSASSSLPTEVLGGLEALFGASVIECYGMTEAASQIAANPLSRQKPGSVGQPAGVEIAILNEAGRPLSTGERGEIHLRGPTITKGYCDDAAANKAAFRQDWFRTGDLGYLDRDGYLFIVGRVKDIVNRGGQKIAPADVEEVLLNHPAVVEAAVFSIPHKRLGEDVAAAVVLSPGSKISSRGLRDFVRKRLARYKVPGMIRIVREIPKGPGGKIKRDGLYAALEMTLPSKAVERGAKLVSPRSTLEWHLAKIWSDLLEVDQIGLNQDVFALGADSLTATQMLSRLRARFAVDFSIKDLLEAPTVAALAARLQSSQSAPTARPPRLRDTSADVRSVSLSYQQQRIYVLSKLDPTGFNYHIVEVLRLSGPLDIAALEAGIAKICGRHEVLRSTFVERQGEPVQAVGTALPPFERLDLRPCAKSTRAAVIHEKVRKLLRQPFKLEMEPALLAQLLRLDDDDHALVVKLHHLVTDGWSQRLFWKELEAHYAASLNGARAILPEVSVQYRHFAEWQRAWLATRSAEEQLSYWRVQLEGLAELPPLQTDRPRPKMWTGRGARHPLKLSRTLSRAIKSLSRAHRVTLFMTLLAAFQCLLFRYTGHADVAVGSLIANRNQIDSERLIGMFANTIVLRTDLSGDPTFSEILRRVRQVTLDAYRNQDLPIEHILRALQVPRTMDRNALFQVMFILQNASPIAPALGELSAQFVESDPGIARFDLTLELMDHDERLGGWFEYSTDLFEAGTIARLATHLRTLLDAIVADPEERISRLPLLPAAERKRVLIDWNDTQRRFRRTTFSERFARQAERAPEAVAVSAGPVRLSYRELARRGSVVADRLVREGVAPDVVVVLLAERGVDFLGAMVAVQRAGGAFLPLDPTIPAARLTQIIQHSRTPLLVAGPTCAALIEKALSAMPIRERPQVLSLAELTQATPRDPAYSVRSAPSSLAYVVYTSGSTGVPKGVMIEQRGLLNHLHSKISDLGLSASDVIAQTAPQSFNVSVWQFLTVLMVGGRVHICTDEVVRDPTLLAQEVGREGVTVLEIVPAVLRAIVERTPSDPTFRILNSLCWLICTGEALAPDLCRSWLRCFPSVPLINAYGQAECSDDVALHRVTMPPLATVPIGRAIANNRLYVLDTHLQPVPIGVAGELCVGGAGVGRGYLNDPELTRRSFLRDPFSHHRGARLYRTGDLARWRADGLLEFVGRVDHQVKIRGYRIEPKEIEHVLVQHADVLSAIVLARNDLGGEARLIAYLVGAGNREPDVNELRDFLVARLPEYMIPTGFIILERMPLTTHGKIDRPVLAAMPLGLQVAGGELVAPRNPTEEVLAAIWADLLAVEDIGVFDNFFALGGHSLLAARVLARVTSAFGVSLPLRVLFEAPTIAALARRLEERETQSNDPAFEIARWEERGPQPVSITQEHVLRIERELPGFPQFNLPLAYRLQGPLNVAALERSLVEVVRRHDSLRTGFAWVDERPIALIVPADDIEISLVAENLAAGTPTGSDRARRLLLKKAELEAEQEALMPLDIGCPPLFRMRLLRLAADDHVLLLTMHHIVIDGWSIGVFMQEISELYGAFTDGRQARLAAPGLQFPDFARWQRWWCGTVSATRQFAYWKEHLREFSPAFPPSHQRSSALLGARADHEPVDLPNDMVARLSALSRSQGGTLFITLLTAFKALLAAQSGRTDICVATAMANRSQHTTEHMIGLLENTTLIRSRIDANLSFEEAFSRVRESVVEAYARQELPFDILATRLAEEDRLDDASIIQVFFVMQNAFRNPLQLSDVAVRSFGNIYRQGQPVLPIDRTWLTVMLKETPSGIVGSWSYKNILFERATIRQWIADYKTILSEATANPKVPLWLLTNR